MEIKQNATLKNTIRIKNKIRLKISLISSKAQIDNPYLSYPYLRTIFTNIA
jgi:hypothetical protein